MYVFFMTTVIPRANTMISPAVEEVGRSRDDRVDRPFLAQIGDQADDDRHEEEQRRRLREVEGRERRQREVAPHPSCQRSFQGMKP